MDSTIETAPRPEFLSGDVQHLLIDGERRPSASGETFETVDPATEEVLARVASGGAADVDAAVASARRALDDPAWAGMSPHERTRVLIRIGELIERHAEELAMIDTLDNGTPITMTRGMMARASEVFRYYSGWPTRLYGETNASVPSQVNLTVREPVGVCAGIIPWNAPVLMAAWKIAPALACGNTCVLKPAEQSPLSALRLGELILEAGVPAGVVNVVTGFGETAGAALAAHSDVDKVAFTGSTTVGKSILAASTGNLKRVTLELGGKSPNIVFPDADLEAAAAASATAFCRLSGQVCAAGTRIFVHESIHDEFVELLAAQATQWMPGNPLDPETKMGPLVSSEQYERVTSYLALGREEGAGLATGGSAVDGRGYFVEPTLFTGVDNRMRIAQEEIFGPVGAVIRFSTEEEAVARANDTRYGLAAAVWTNDLSRTHRMARAIKAGTVWVNQIGPQDPALPFGGYKESGIGREHGSASIDMYTETKTVMMQLR
jgi:acyl-CoA reductase-like NAD-dependent aldehyde dehydrogenase